MTIAQIAAVISFLWAFNVPQATVNNVQNILLNTSNVSQIQQPQQSQSAPISGVSVTSAQTPTSQQPQTVPAPTCTLDGYLTAGASGVPGATAYNEIDAKIHWVTQNATSGTLRQIDVTYNTASISAGELNSTIASGTVEWNVGYGQENRIYTIDADLSGPGGTGQCNEAFHLPAYLPSPEGVKVYTFSPDGEIIPQ